jgi:ribosome assembly protein 1
VEQITAFGPRRTGANVLIDTTKDCICGRLYVTSLSISISANSSSLRDSAEEKEQAVGDTLQARDFSDKIGYAFQLATAQGPLCNEPVQGIAVFLEEVTLTPSTDDESSARDKLGRLTGEVIKTVQQAIKQGFLDWSPRLLLAMYSCEIQASSKPTAFPFHS